MIGWLKRLTGSSSSTRQTKLETGKKRTVLGGEWRATIGPANWPAQLASLTADAATFVGGNWLQNGSWFILKLHNRTNQGSLQVNACVTSVYRQFDGKWRITCKFSQKLPPRTGLS